MPLAAPSCSVYACHDAATFALLPAEEQGIISQLPIDCLCVTHWLHLQVVDPDRAYRYLSVRYTILGQDDPAVTPEPTSCGSTGA